jgi:hypothetical protein
MENHRDLCVSAPVTSPEEFFGLQMGSDRCIARWDRIVAYFRQLAEESDRAVVIDMGPSTEGNPFLLVVISSSRNLGQLEDLRQINLRLSDPRGLVQDEVEPLVKRGRAVVCQSMSLHATEIGGTQMAPELAYELLVREDEEARRILDNVVFLMIPCFNPDGQIMVADWYKRWLGTEYEGCGLPWLYHRYAGHDNNRDAFQTNLVESQYMATILFREWKPQVYLDHHHMGSYGARLYVPPYCEPIHPYADPLIWREHSWYGAHIAYKLEEAGKTGVVNAAMFSGWGHLGFHWITAYHNIAGMLTESASAKLASPLYIHYGQLRGDRRETVPSYDAQTNFPNPWRGGWWRLRDIVEQQKISAWATLDLAARHRETVVRNAYLKAARQTEAGARGTPRAYVIPADQHDPLTTAKMVEKLLAQGIEVHLARGTLRGGNSLYTEGSYVVSLAQPKLGVAKTLLGRTLYPDNAWTRSKSGEPLRPYDTATDTMAEAMGVRVDDVDGSLEGELVAITAPILPATSVPSAAPYGYALDCRWNDSYAAVNGILARGGEVHRATGTVETADEQLPPGCFVVLAAQAGLLEEICGALHVGVVPLLDAPADLYPLTRPRVGVYQGYFGGNADEGWTRLVLEQFAFPHVSLMDADLRKGDLRDRVDVLVLPSASTEVMTGQLDAWWKEHRPHQSLPVYPPEYVTGFGEEGMEAIKDLVCRGGRLVTLSEACEFAISLLSLPVRDVVRDTDTSRFFCPGSTLHARFDNRHPVGYGMPREGLVLFWNSPAFDVVASPRNEDIGVVASYPDRDLLQSGWLIGEEMLRRKAALVSARSGQGEVVLIGFRAQHRAQTHGTFKLLFNSLLHWPPTRGIEMPQGARLDR